MTAPERRWIAAIVSLAEQLRTKYKGGHRPGCIQLVASAVVQCDCGYDQVLIDIGRANTRLSALAVKRG